MCVGRKQLEVDAIDGGYHETLMRDAETGKIIRKPKVENITENEPEIEAEEVKEESK